MALRQAVLKPVILFESNCQTWEPNRWQHCDINTLEDTFLSTCLKFEITLFARPIKSFRFWVISSLSVRSYVTMLPRCLALLVHFNKTLFIYSGGALLKRRDRPLKRIHTVFLALNNKSYSCANDSQIRVIDFRQAKLGAKRAKSSAEHNAPKYSWATKHPNPLFPNLLKITSIYNNDDNEIV